MPNQKAPSPGRHASGSRDCSMRRVPLWPFMALLLIGSASCNTTSKRNRLGQSSLKNIDAGLSLEAGIISTRPLDTGASFRLGYGYDRLSGQRMVSCLDKELYEIKGRNIRSTERQTVMINSKEELARELNLQVNAEASSSYESSNSTMASKTQLLRKATFSDRSMMALLKFVHRAQSVELEQADLNAENQILLGQDNKAFRLKCGDAYTSSVTTGSAIYVLVHIINKSSEIVDRTTTTKNMNKALDNMFSGNSTANVSNEAKNLLSQYNITMDCLSQGVNASACSEPVLAVGAEDSQILVEFMNKISKVFADSVDSNPSMYVSVDEKFEHYAIPSYLGELPRDEVFYDYSLRQKDVENLLNHELYINQICNIQQHSSCESIRRTNAEQIRACARQDNWADCKPNFDGLLKLFFEISRNGPGSVHLFDRNGFQGKKLMLEFNRHLADPSEIQPHKVYNLSDFGYNDLATEFSASLTSSWQLRLFEHSNAMGRCFLIEGKGKEGELAWFKGKASSFRLEKKSDFPSSCG